MGTLVIGVTGRAHGGKSSTASAMLSEATRAGYSAEVFEVSSYILKEAKDRDLIAAIKTRPDLNASELQILVDLGQQLREEAPGVWLDRLFLDIDTKKPDVALVPNVRFIDEAKRIRQRSGKIIRVTSLLAENVEYISKDRDPNDRSEIEHYSVLADYFITVKRGESDLLKKQAATLMRYLMTGN